MLARRKAETSNSCKFLMGLWHDGVLVSVQIDWHNGVDHLANFKRNQTVTELYSYVILFLLFLVRAA